MQRTTISLSRHFNPRHIYIVYEFVAVGFLSSTSPYSFFFIRKNGIIWNICRCSHILYVKKFIHVSWHETFDKTNQKDNKHHVRLFVPKYNNKVFFLQSIHLSHSLLTFFPLFPTNNEHNIYVAIEMSFIGMTRSFFFVVHENFLMCWCHSTAYSQKVAFWN